MITYNNTLIEYFKANDTEFKRYVNEKFQESNRASFIGFIDNFFYNLGLMSTNIVPIENGKWEAYYVLGHDNMFTNEVETINATDGPIKRKDAEEKLAAKIIELLAFLDVSEVKNRINLKHHVK